MRTNWSNNYQKRVPRRTRPESKAVHIRRAYSETQEYCDRIDASRQIPAVVRKPASAPCTVMVSRRETVRLEPTQFIPPQIARPTPPTARIIAASELSIDVARSKATVGGIDLGLTDREYQMLVLLARHQGSPVTRDMFLDCLYQDLERPGPTIIDLHLSHLRKKLSVASRSRIYIENVRRRGWILRESNEYEAQAAE